MFFPQENKVCDAKQMDIFLVVFFSFLARSNVSKDDLCVLPISTIPTNPEGNTDLAIILKYG